MKILSIELKNINSLAGEWKIDFTDPSFVRNHNIFVIFGDTGAGKSSILDAVTLALYGRTPRQDKINNNHNEVMTRNTATCYARLKYQCRKGVFISEWRQKRAKEKISGKLQDPEFLITKGDGTFVDEGKAARLSDLTQKIIELDYKQFVRSIILAQGEFSKFLDCKPNERAEILEKLDGSDNYRKIAIAIANRTDEEEKLFNLKKQKVEAISGLLLSDEDIEKKNAELEALAVSKAQLEEKLEILRKYIQWYDVLAEKKQSVEEARNKLKAAEEEKAFFEPSAAKLKKGENALLCEASYTSLSSSRNNLKKDSDAFEAASDSLQKADDELARCEKNREAAAKTLASCEQEFAKMQPVWEAVSVLDAKIENTRTQVEKASSEYDSAFKEHSSSRKELSDAKESLSVLSKEASSYETYKKENSTDSGISSILSGLQEKKNRLCSVFDAEDNFVKFESNILPELSGLEERYKELEAAISESEKYLSDNEKDSELTEIIPSVKALCDGMEVMENSVAETERLLSKTEQDLSLKKKEAETLLESKNKVLSELEGFFADDALFIAGELQKRLRAGEACPVCGSLEHPACNGSFSNDENISVMERTAAFAERVREAQSRRDKIDAALQAAEREAALLQKEKSSLVEKKTSLAVQMEESRKKLSVLAEPWVKNFSEIDGEKLLAFLTEKSVSFRTHEKTLSSLKEKLSSCNVELSGKRKDFENNSASLAAARSEKEKLASEIKELCVSFVPENELSSFAEESSQSVRSFAESLYVSLKNRAERWQDNTESLEKTEEELSRLTADEKVLEERMKNLEENEKKAASALGSCREALSALQADRFSRFGDMSVDESRRSFDERLAFLRSEVKTAESSSVEAQLAVGKFKTSVKEAEERIKADKASISSDEVLFFSKLSEAGFSSEEDFVSNRLDSTSLESLRQRSRALAERKIAAESSVKDAEKSLLAHEQMYGDIPSLEDVNEQSDSAEKELEEATANIARIKAELDSDRQSRKESNERLKEFEAQKTVFDKWNRLKDLMGNKDGSSFSIFVQGITFRHLLTLANRHLSLMKERYTLIPKDNVDFEINDASFSSPRSVTNISGGERFLISLALALGIADFASRTVRVDSLFLDEGFGSLDGDTLRSVLDCLKRQQQKEGKMLGIITHVDTVVDSIAQKIEVKPSAGGHSVIRGEGVSGSSS